MEEIRLDDLDHVVDDLDEVLRQLDDAIGYGRPVLLVGVGSAPTFVARRIRVLVTQLTDAQADEAVYEAAGLNYPEDGVPLRAPHHTVGLRAMTGDKRLPGEIALAGGGVLYLDEIAEFRRAVLEAVFRAFGKGEFVLVGSTAPEDEERCLQRLEWVAEATGEGEDVVVIPVMFKPVEMGIARPYPRGE